MSTKPLKLTVFYDANCIVCSREISHYRRQKHAKRITFVDITQPQFDPNDHGLDAEAVHRVFHVKQPDGKILTGIPAFVAIWRTLEIFSPLVYIAQTRLGGSAMNLGYRGFALLRPYLPRRASCDDGACRV